MNANWKNTTAWATAGSLIGAVVVVVLKGNQVDVVEHYAATVGGIAACVAAGVAALLVALKGRKS